MRDRCDLAAVATVGLSPMAGTAWVPCWDSWQMPATRDNLSFPLFFPAGPILARGHGGFLLPLLTSTWATSLVAAMAGLATPETVSSLEGTGASISAAKDKLAGAVGEAANAAAAAVHEE